MSGVIVDERDQKFILACLVDGDRVGCRLQDGQVYLPHSFHKAYQRYCSAKGCLFYGLPSRIQCCYRPVSRPAPGTGERCASRGQYLKNVLPEVDAAVKAIKHADLTFMDMADASFAA